MKERREREIPEKTRRPTASSGTIPTCENPVAWPDIEHVSPWWEASVLTAQPPSPLSWYRDGGNAAVTQDSGAQPMSGHFSTGEETIGRRCYGRREGVPISCLCLVLCKSSCLSLSLGKAEPIWSSAGIVSAGETGDSRENPDNQRRRTAQFPRTKFQERPIVNRTRDLRCSQHRGEPERVKRSEYGAAPECKGGGKREIPEKTHRPVASSGTMTTCENPGVIRPEIEPCSHWWAASSLTTPPLRPLLARKTRRFLDNCTRLQYTCITHYKEDTSDWSISSRVTPGFLQVGIVPDDAAGRRVYSEISSFPRLYIPPLPHTHLTSPSSALKTFTLRTTQIYSHPFPTEKEVGERHRVENEPQRREALSSGAERVRLRNQLRRRGGHVAMIGSVRDLSHFTYTYVRVLSKSGEAFELKATQLKISTADIADMEGQSFQLALAQASRERERYIVGLIKDDGHYTCLCLCCDAPARDEALAGSVLAGVCPAGPGGQDTPGGQVHNPVRQCGHRRDPEQRADLKNYVNCLLYTGPCTPDGKLVRGERPHFNLALSITV
ncbi:hypothetical protein PR048_025733 [Dryococelus australis]|uniref:Uncharacterized protein n=1 Tax=Dryococelus australis TaxID=614101 RepID=A0ABQ9GJE4_9NEOP|nr:hypothetical protein PR048_025733 [Dryococelus australis]